MGERHRWWRRSTTRGHSIRSRRSRCQQQLLDEGTRLGESEELLKDQRLLLSRAYTPSVQNRAVLRVLENKEKQASHVCGSTLRRKFRVRRYHWNLRGREKLERRPQGLRASVVEYGGKTCSVIHDGVGCTIIIIG